MKTPTLIRTRPATDDTCRRPAHARMSTRTHSHMLWRTMIVTVLGLQISGGGVAAISIETAPPVVIKTSPPAGAIGVDPALTEIRVTFSKPMQDGSWSWSTWGEENFPEMVGRPRYLSDGRTCVLTVKLEPGKFYGTWLNSDKFKNFKDRDGHAAVPYLLTFATRSAASGVNAMADSAFGPAVEAVLPSPAGTAAVLLDLDTGHRASSETFGMNDRQTHSWIRANQLDLLAVVEKEQIAVLCMDMVAAPATSNGWDTISASNVATNWNLAQGEAKTVMGISPLTDKTDVWLFRTREGGMGVLQILGPTVGLDGVRVRYRLLASATGSVDGESAVRDIATGSAGAIHTAGSDPSARLLNADQQAVVAWTDRQFRSYFDDRTFNGWTAEDIKTLETKCLDALNGPRGRDYYTAINTLGALRSTNALPQLRGIAFERVDGNNRNRWMAVRVLGIMGDRQSVPDLVTLVYHGNPNTRWGAQIALVQLTGQNFGGDWDAWGKWWNESGGQPAYHPEIIRWWSGQAETVEGLRQSLEENDRKFLESIAPGDTMPKDTGMGLREDLPRPGAQERGENPPKAPIAP